MRKSDFDVFSDIIYQYYKELEHIDKRDFNGKVLKFRSQRLFLVYYYYESLRKDIRKLYMSDEAKPMDRHKIAASVMCAILKGKVVKVQRLIPNLPMHLLMANEYIAFYCALNLVEMYVRDAVDNKEYSLVMPQTLIEEENPKTSYIENICKVLYYTKNIRVCDVLSYANILFLLEKYTNTLILQKK